MTCHNTPPVFVAESRSGDAPGTSRTRPPSRQTRRRIAFSSLAAAAISGVLVGCVLFGCGSGEHPTRSSHPAALGQTLTSFQLQPLTDDAVVQTPSTLRGKVTLINLWGPWCQFCRVEMPHLNQLQQRLAPRSDFQFLSVSCTPDRETEQVEVLREDTERYLRDASYSFPVHHDPGGELRQALARVSHRGEEGLAYPLSVLLDRSGIIRGFWMGSSAEMEAALEATVEEVLGEPERALSR